MFLIFFGKYEFYKPNNDFRWKNSCTNAILPYLDSYPIKIDLKSLKTQDLNTLFSIYSRDKNDCRQVANSFLPEELNSVLSTFSNEKK